MVGQALGMSRRTVDENIRRYIQEEKQEILKRGKPHPKWDDEMKDYAIKMVEDVDTLGGGLAPTRFSPRSRWERRTGGFSSTLGARSLLCPFQLWQKSWTKSSSHGRSVPGRVRLE